jgi:tRNA A-37 threonylcarbamoyl transferase component Bud32
MKYTILNRDTEIGKSKVVKKFVRSTLLKDKILVPWSDSKKDGKVHRLFRLGTVYKAWRYLRSIGLRTPLIESVVIKTLLITEHIKGTTLKYLTDELLSGINDNSFHWLEIAGEEIAKIHITHSVLRGLRPTDLISSDQGIFFVGLEGFSFFIR